MCNWLFANYNSIKFKNRSDEIFNFIRLLCVSKENAYFIFLHQIILRHSIIHYILNMTLFVSFQGFFILILSYFILFYLLNCLSNTFFKNLHFFLNPRGKKFHLFKLCLKTAYGGMELNAGITKIF